MEEKILFVDDEEKILNAFRRQLRKLYTLETASDGLQGLEMLVTQGPFAVVVADFRMPGMDGVQFLAKVREISPETVRIMLTGHADLNTAVDAINSGNIFRFLTKPTAAEDLVIALNSAVEQHRLVTAERDLLEKTLKTSVQLLTDVLSLASPQAFSRALRIRRIVGRIAVHLRLYASWKFEMSAMLSQIGTIALPQTLLEKASQEGALTSYELNLLSSHPLIGYRLLAQIPRLETIARMVRDQNQHYCDFEADHGSAEIREAQLGAQILHVALDYDRYIQKGLSHQEALRRLSAEEGSFNPLLVAALGEGEIIQEHWMVRLIEASSAERGMLLQEDVLSKAGEIVAPKHQEITAALLERLQIMSQTYQIVEPFKVLVRMKGDVQYIQPDERRHALRGAAPTG